MKLGNKCCSFLIFTGRSTMSEGSADPNDLFNLGDVHVATVNIVTNSRDGAEEGLVGGDVVGEWNGVLGSAKRRQHSNGGTRTYG